MGPFVWHTVLYADTSSFVQSVQEQNNSKHGTVEKSDDAGGPNTKVYLCVERGSFPTFWMMDEQTRSAAPENQVCLSLIATSLPLYAAHLKLGLLQTLSRLVHTFSLIILQSASCCCSFRL